MKAYVKYYHLMSILANFFPKKPIIIQTIFRLDISYNAIIHVTCTFYANSHSEYNLLYVSSRIDLMNKFSYIMLGSSGVTLN